MSAAIADGAVHLDEVRLISIFLSYVIRIDDAALTNETRIRLLTDDSHVLSDELSIYRWLVKRDFRRAPPRPTPSASLSATGSRRSARSAYVNRFSPRMAEPQTVVQKPSTSPRRAFFRCRARYRHKQFTLRNNEGRAQHRGRFDGDMPRKPHFRELYVENPRLSFHGVTTRCWAAG